MVHRDIKPGNLMLSHKKKRAMIKVLDFGLAKATSEQMRATWGSVGRPFKCTLPTASPAPARCSARPRPSLPSKSSMLRRPTSARCLQPRLYSLLPSERTCGPFQATTVHRVLLAHQTMDATPLSLVRSEMPAELSALVDKMMAKEPDRRFQEPDEVAQAYAVLQETASRPRHSEDRGFHRRTSCYSFYHR